MTAPRRLAARAADYVALAKPRITAMAVVMAALCHVLAPGPVDLARAALALLGIALAVAAANALNMYLERDGDALMERTQARPLPGGRMNPAACLAFGVILGAGSLVMLWLVIGALTGLLATVALVNYVGIYTPLKRRTTWAVIVGAVSGAMPVLMGWTAASGRLDPTGLLLFAVLFVWQVPHFIAISIFRQDEYDRAGIRIVPTERGRGVAKVQAVAYTTALVPLSLALAATSDASWGYVAVALLANAAFLGLSIEGLRTRVDEPWARRFFQASLVYVPVLVVALLVDTTILS